VAIGSVYRPFLEIAREAGADVEAELARFGLKESELSEARLPPLHGRALVLRLAARCGGSRELGLEAAQRARLTDLDILGYMARHAEHALAALEALARYALLLGDTADCRVSRQDGQVLVEFGLTGGREMLPDGSDFAAALLARVVLEISGGEARPLEVCLPRSRPRRQEAYRRHFGVMPAFGAERMSLRYLEAALLHPTPARDQRLHSILEARAAESVASMPAEDVAWLNGVRTRLGRAIELGQVDLSSIASRCGMSDRSLRRHLEAAGTSFRQLADDVRRQRALQLIDEGQTRIGAIAQATGYTDPTAFARAFRRWTGLPPQQYLAQHRPGDYPNLRPLPVSKLRAG
jgi:AraC-like DNA-binding protein